MENWKIKDNKIICYNLYNKLHPYEAQEPQIAKKIAQIMKKKGCDELTATEIYKADLRAELEAKNEHI